MARKTDDNFYSQMAADFDSNSDVSDADPIEMSKTLANLDDLDAGLFTPRDKKNIETKSKPIVNTKKAAAKSDFDDLDDDLADAIDDILGDDGGVSLSKPAKKQDENEEEAEGLAFTDSECSSKEDKLPTSSFTPKIETPPPKVAPTPSKPEIKKDLKPAITFSSDEDDLLPDQNLSKTAPAEIQKPSAPRKRSSLFDDDEEEARPARSALNSLLSKPKAVSDLEKAPPKKEFSLDAKYTTAGAAAKKGATSEEDDNFWGSSYRPSTAGNQPKRRSVHFEDEMDFGLAKDKRPETAPMKSGAADWLGLGDDLDFSAPVKSRQSDPLSQTAPLPSTKSDSGADKFVSRFEVSGSPPRNPAPVDNSYLDLGQEVDLDSLIASKKKGQKMTPEPSSPERINDQPKFPSSENISSSPTKQDFNFDLDLEPKTKSTTFKPSRRRRSGSGSPKSASPDRSGQAPGSTLVSEKPSGGRHLAEMFKSEREDSMQAVFQQTQMQQEMMRKQQEAMQAANRNFYPQIGSMSLTGDSTMVMELENRIKKLEMEKEHLNAMMEMLKRRHGDELQLMEESHKNKVQILEESYQRREQRYRDENALLSEQNLEKSKAVERERADMRTELNRRAEDIERERAREISRIRDVHREEMDELRREHSRVVDGLRVARQQEYEAIRDAQPTARSIQTVLDQLSSSTKDLSSLQTKVDSSHSANREEKEVALRVRDEQLRTLEDRLRRQEEDTQRERERLQDIVSKMDIQMREQTRLMEEEKWKMKQEGNRLNAQHTALDEERRTLMEQIRRERESVEKSKSAVLAEQKQLLAQLFDERKVLAEERVQFNLQQNEWMEKQQKSSVRVVQNEADLEGQLRITQEEKRRVAVLESELREARDAVRRDKMALERERAVIEGERARLEALEADIRRREHSLEEREEECERLRRTGDSALFTAKQTEEEQQQRLSNIASQQAQLRSKEKQMTQDRLQLARQREEIDKMRDSILCVNCRVPVRDIPSFHSPMRASMTSPISPSIRQGYTEGGDPMALRAIRRSQEVAQAMEADRTLRMLQLEAERDEEFLQEEKAFLQNLQRASYQT